MLPSPRLILALALFGMTALSAGASAVVFQITPDDLLEAGYAFDIKTDRLQDGNVLFRIRIIGETLATNSEVRVFTNLEIHKAISVPLREIVAEKHDKFLSCVFLVPEESLAAIPELTFDFGLSGVRVASGDFYRLRLNDFYKAPAGLSVPESLELAKEKAGAESGYPMAQVMLGYRSELGEGVPKDLAQAYK